MPSFKELGLPQCALEAIERLGFETPTPVQEQAIPIALKGDDLIAAASTGTGKTAAFLLPLLGQLPRAEKGRRAPRVLVITPTRELAQQIAGTCIKIARICGHYVTTVYGGTIYKKQISELLNGTDILIATPGRLKDLMDRGVVDLSKIESLVLDEADRMLDMGFLPDVTYIVEAIPEDRQTLLFSATIDKSIMRNFNSLLKDPKTVQIAKKGDVAESVDHYIMPIKHKNKDLLLKALLDELGSDRVIVFARTKVRAEEVARMLNEAGFDSECIHSDRTQGQRRTALNRFRKGDVGIIVATDVLARGIDVPAVDYVVNYDLPDMAEDYIHRIGRTGRAGEKGLALSFVSQNSVRLLQAIENLIHQEIPVKELESYDLDLGVLKKRKKGAPRKTKHQAHSDERAKRFKESRRRKQEKAFEETEYNYEGWGDLREGKPKRSKEEREADRASRTKSRKTEAKSQKRDDSRKKSRKNLSSEGNNGRWQQGPRKGRDRTRRNEDERPKKKKGRRKNQAFKKGVSGKAKNAKKKAAREAKRQAAR